MTLTHTATPTGPTRRTIRPAPWAYTLRRGGRARDEPPRHAGRPVTRLAGDDARGPAVTQAPVIFSHSSARALVDHRAMCRTTCSAGGRNGGVVMVNFLPDYVSARRGGAGVPNSLPSRHASTARPSGVSTSATRARRRGPARLGAGASVPAGYPQGRGRSHRAHPHGRARIMSAWLGLRWYPQGLRDWRGWRSSPALLEELARRGWTDADLAKVAGANLLRVRRETEAVSRRLRATELPSVWFCRRRRRASSAACADAAKTRPPLQLAACAGLG